MDLMTGQFFVPQIHWSRLVVDQERIDMEQCFGFAQRLTDIRISEDTTPVGDPSEAVQQ